MKENEELQKEVPSPMADTGHQENDAPLQQVLEETKESQAIATNAEQQQMASNMNSEPGTDAQRPQLNSDSKLDEKEHVPVQDGESIEPQPIGADKTMYSVTDENISERQGMATGGFEKAKLSRSQLEQRSIIQLKDDQPAIMSVDDGQVEEALADHATDIGDVMGSTVRQQTIELEGSMLQKHANQAMKGSNQNSRPMGLVMLGNRK